MVVAMPTYRFSVDEYERMVEASVFDEDARVELIRGEIVAMSPIGEAHVFCLAAVTDAVANAKGRDLLLLVQSPIRLPDGSRPQPDLAIARPAGHRRTLPSPPDVLLVAEVADSSLNHDRSVKLPLYAEAGIPEAWLFDVVAEQIERHTEPRQGRYRQITIAGRGERLASTVVPSVTFDADDVFGERSIDLA